jgi:hypothetical protein
MLIIGGKDMEAGNVSVRLHHGGGGRRGGHAHKSDVRLVCAKTSRFVHHSWMRSSFIDGWNVTPSIRCSGNCTG